VVSRGPTTYFSEFAKALGVQGYETIPAGKAIAWCYGGLVFRYGLMSQWLKRKFRMTLTFKFNHGIHFLKCF
jgi:hypothetical protein